MALAPVTAQAQDRLLTSPTTDLAQSVPAQPSADLVSQVRAVGLIEKRAQKLQAGVDAAAAVENNDGSTLWKSRAYEPLLPASTMKLLTATVALSVLGPNWRPVTTVTFDEATGTLALVGGGDAVLTSTQLRTLASNTVLALENSGGQATRLVIDDSLFPAPRTPAGVLPAQQPSQVRPVRALVVDRRTSMDTALDAGRTFASMLADKGVSVRFAGRAVSSGGSIATMKGVTLRSSLRTMLWYSDNDIAEMTFRLSAIGAGAEPTWAGARSTAQDQLALLGVPLKGVEIIDGSGLSRRNRLSAFVLTETLRLAAENPGTDLLRSLLPAAGEEGTLRTRFDIRPSKCVRGILKAKTGGLHDVISLAGYAPLTDGTVRPFAIIVNHVQDRATARNDVRRAIDGLAASFSGC